MSSFTCQHLDVANDYCLLLKTDCVPGRKGCVLRGTSGFLVSAEERVRMLKEESVKTRNPKPRQPVHRRSVARAVDGRDERFIRSH
jgi:hypothetical protein